MLGVLASRGVDDIQIYFAGKLLHSDCGRAHTVAETSAVTWRIIANYCYPIENTLRGVKKMEQNREMGSETPPKCKRLFLGPRSTPSIKFINIRS